MHGCGLCVKVDSYVAHMPYACPFSSNKSFTIALRKNKYFPSLNTNTTVLAWGAVNSNKI